MNFIHTLFPINYKIQNRRMISSNLVLLTIVGLISRHTFQRSSYFRYVVRLLLFLLSIAASSFLTLLLSPILYLLRKGLVINRTLGDIFTFVAPLLTGINFELIDGRQHLPKPNELAVFVANHQSMLDMLFLATALPSRTVVTAKKEVRWIPFMGWIMQAGLNIFIDRGNKVKAVKGMIEVGERMIKDNVSVWVFPEGTRSHQIDNTLLPFKKGAFHLAKQNGLKIVPIVASTYGPCYDERRWKFESGTVCYRILEGIESKDKSVDELMALTRERMEAALRDLKTRPSDEF